MSSAKALRPIGRGNGTRPRGNSGAVSSSDPDGSVYSVYRAHHELPKGSTARELGWRLAPRKTIEERERAPAGLDRSSLPLLARLGPPGTSAFPPLLGAKRTSVGEYERSRFMSTRQL